MVQVEDTEPAGGAGDGGGGRRGGGVLKRVRILKAAVTGQDIRAVGSDIEWVVMSGGGGWGWSELWG